MKYLLIILLCILLAGCNAEILTCKSPTKLIGKMCCVDDNDNGVCDAYETKTEQPVVSKPVSDDDFSSAKLLHWKHLPITYYINSECGDYESRQIARAFDEIQNSTNDVVTFKKISNSTIANIHFSCEYIEGCYVEKTWIEHIGNTINTYKSESICAYNRGLANYRTLGKVITEGHITMYGFAGFAETYGRGMSGFFIGTCGDSRTEIHEILHTLGFLHVDNPDSIMYFQGETVGHKLYTEGSCTKIEKTIDSAIVKDLVETYKK